MEKEDLVSQHATNSRIVMRIIVVGIVINIVLTAVKLGVGVVFDNLAVISDAATSGADIFTSLLIMVALFVSSPKRDKKHNYGHEKMEPMAVLFLSLMLFTLGVVLAWQGIEGIINPSEPEINAWLVGVIVLSLVVKEGMFFVGMHYAKKTKSEILRADAWQSRADSLSSVAVLAGLVSSIFNDTNIVESIAVVIVAGFVFKVAFDTFKPAFNQLTDRAASDEVCEKIVKIASESPGVIKVHRLRTRIFGSQIFAELEIVVDGKLSTKESYKLGGVVHDALEGDDSLRIKDVSVVVMPDK